MIAARLSPGDSLVLAGTPQKDDETDLSLWLGSDGTPVGPARWAELQNREKMSRRETMLLATVPVMLALFSTAGIWIVIHLFFE